jgi:catechol 2,3-dioxygenase-like lactoylglutathione lyase family enzyme
MPLLIPLLIVLLASAPAGFAQLTAAREAPLAMGHYHFNVTDLAEHRRFWVDLLGGEPARLGDLEVVKFPNTLVFLRSQKPTGGTIGSSIDHIGFEMPEVPAMVAKMRQAGIPVVTKQEITGNRAKGDIFFSPSQRIYLAYILGPDGIKIEMVENRALERPIASHHIHFFPDDVKKMQDWHVKTFGAVAAQRGPFQEGVVPGIHLTYSKAEKAVAGTKGRVLDHIGFEVDGLRQLCQRLEAQGIKLDRPYQEVPALGIAIAFFTDPWGNYIELTEGLDRL